MESCHECRKGIITSQSGNLEEILRHHVDDDVKTNSCCNMRLYNDRNSLSNPQTTGRIGSKISNSSAMRMLHILLVCFVFLHCFNSLPKTEARSRRNDAYHWKTGAWRDCEGTECGEGGVQLRSVTCVSDRKWRGLHSFCDATKKPGDQRPCFKVCDEHRHIYRWQAADWGECGFVTTRPVTEGTEDKCGLGIVQVGSQIRNITCVSGDDPSVVVESYICDRFAPPPFSMRPCEVPCPINCVTSHWSEWSKCSRTCGNGTQHRTRQVYTNAKYGGEYCPKLASTRPCVEQQPCDPLLLTFFSHTLKFGNWTDCEPAKFELGVSSGGNRRKNRKENRRKLNEVDRNLVGGRSRKITCFNVDGDPLGDSISVTETCTVSKNCEVTEWSEWSICAAKCGRMGTRYRTRDVKLLSSGSGGEECPELEEVEDCQVDVNLSKKCSEYTWVTGGWDECQTIDNATCGGGTQQRDVYCVVRNEFTIYMASSAVAKGGDAGLREWAKMQPVDEENCDQRFKPPIWKQCDVPCAAMCEVGEWSDWSDCAPERCSSEANGLFSPQHLRGSRKSQRSGFKRRERVILDSLNGNDGCPHTTEVIPCEEARCFRWHSVSVSPCVATRGKCGEGTQQQTIVCKDMWGKDVDAELCRRKPEPPRIEETLPCFVPCSSDCVVSEWSSWTPCTNDCKRGRRESGEQNRKRKDSKEQSRFREILANAGPGGKDCLPVSKLQETRSCNQHRCSIYFWNIGSWSECLVKSNVTSTPPALTMRQSDMFMSDDGNNSQPLYFPSMNEEQVCGKGYQIRRVKCRKKDSGLVSDKLCGTRRSIPLKTRDCTFPCPKDCVLSEWGEWTDCEKECDKVARPGQGAPGPIYQERHRVVVQHRTGRGTPCPLERKERITCMEPEKCKLYRWEVSKWSECVRIQGAATIYADDSSKREVRCLGAMTRNVQCRHISLNGENRAAESRLCFKYADRSPPEKSQHCLVRCKPDRSFKNWMDGMKCSATVHNIESYEELYGLQATMRSDLSHITMQKTAEPVGDWSSCNITKSDHLPLASLLQKKASDPYCGVGTRQRALACYIEGTNTLVDNSHCQYRDFQMESCEIPCPVDCLMSPWASWGKCGDNVVGRRTAGIPVRLPCGENIRMRHRYQTGEPQNGGRRCPAIDSLRLEYETELCRTVCDTFFWEPMAWRQCTVNRNGAFSNCGQGYQTRSPECYKTDRASGYPDVARVVDDMRQCDTNIMPLGHRNCTSPCQGECVYSEWSSWRPCEATNENQDSCSGIRRRSRVVLRQVAPETGLPNTHCDNPRATTQTESCELNSNCYSYSAMWTEWSSCMMPFGARCGTGVRRRRSNCISSTGLPVHEDKCAENGVTIPPPEHKVCHSICPIDCELSEWSKWSQCAGPCDGVVQRTRTRKIIRQPSVLGRPCSVTEEKTPCPVKACHEWALGEWSDCRIPGGNCGTGLRTKDVRCLQQDGQTVSNSLCQSAQGDLGLWFGDPELRQDCQITCAGECHMTEWTDWSDCHLRCINITTPVAGVTAGVQTRSRVGFKVGQIDEGECPLQEIEEKPCPLEDAKCYFYEWKTTPTFHRGKRPVWCQRNIDGLNVSSGCQDQFKLQKELYCTQICDSIENAYCGDHGICECDTGYKAKTLSTGRLLSCEETQPNDDADTVKIVKIHIDATDEVTNVQKDPVDSEPVATATTSSTTETTKEAILPETTEEIQVKKSGFFENLGLLTETGQLKPWVYGAIIGLIIFLIFIIASIYLICVACRRKKKQPAAYGLYSTKNIKSSKKLHKHRHKRRHGSSGSNVGVGMVIGMGPPRFPPSNSAMSHTSSTSRSGGYSHREYDDILWKET